MEKVIFFNYDGIFHSRLRDLIEEHDITKQKLSEEIGVSRQAISQYCDGSTIPNADKLLKIAEFFNVSTDYLLGLTDVQGTDTEVKAICEYTGLSEEAIEELHYQVELRERKQSDYPWFTNDMFFENQKWIDEHFSIVNYIICSPAFQVAIGNIIGYMDELKKRISNIDNLIKRIKIKNTLDFDSVCEIEKLSNTEHTRIIRLDHFEMIEALKIAAEKYCKAATDKCEEAENTLDKYLIESFKYKDKELTDEEAKQLEKCIFEKCASIRRETDEIIQRMGDYNADNNQTE